MGSDRAPDALEEIGTVDGERAEVVSVGWALEVAGDDALVAGIGDRDREALAEAYRRHGGAVWAITRRLCRGTALAEEVCAAVFAELWSGPERYDPARGSLRSWLVARAHARAVGVARADGPRAPAPDAAPDQTPPSAEVQVAEHAAALVGAAGRAVERLAPVQRDAILLTYLGGHSSREAARLLDAPEDTVKGHVRRGLLNLRRAFDAQEVAP